MADSRYECSQHCNQHCNQQCNQHCNQHCIYIAIAATTIRLPMSSGTSKLRREFTTAEIDSCSTLAGQVSAYRMTTRPGAISRHVGKPKSACTKVLVTVYLSCRWMLPNPASSDPKRTGRPGREPSVRADPLSKPSRPKRADTPSNVGEYVVKRSRL